MNKLKLQYNKALLLLGVLFLTWNCSDSWLTPKPLSFYAPENTFVNNAGFQAALAASSANIRWMYSNNDGNSRHFFSEFIFSDVYIQGQTDQRHSHNWDVTLNPTEPLGDQAIRISQWWDEGWFGLGMANTVIANIDIPAWNSPAERNAVLGAAYFHRAWRYYNLTHQFGDVPWVGDGISAPRTNFYSYDRWSILERIKTDLEFAWEWAPATAPGGMVTKWTAGVLLVKTYMALAEFDKAIAVGQQIVAAKPMMRNRFAQGRFGSNAGLYGGDFGNQYGDRERTTLMHDLHSIEGKIDPTNTEAIFMIINDPSGVNGAGNNTGMMRMSLPGWDVGGAFWVSPADWTARGMRADGNAPFNMNRMYGRGITMFRPTHFYGYKVWDIPTREIAQPDGMRERGIPVAQIDSEAFRATSRFTNDMRSPLHMQIANPEPGSLDPADQGAGARRLRRTAWRFPEDMLYNDDRGLNEPYYLTYVQRPPQLTDQVYIRSYYHWPHYKTWVPHPRAGAQTDGGPSPWYVYRTPEVYLLMAEAYYWKGDSENARAMLNEVSGRAGAVDLPAGTQITIAHILSERARELSMEEFRKSELTRIAFLYALTGKPCEYFGGRVYRFTEHNGNSRIISGVGGNQKMEGINFFYDWILYANTFMNRGITHPNATYQFSVHHVLWPVPNSAITANTTGHLNQPVGYSGAENNLLPRIVE